MTSTEVLASFVTVLFVAVIYLAISVFRLSERIARVEERTRQNRRNGD